MVTVHNHDVVGLYDRLSRFYEEAAKSVSAGVSQFGSFDQDRTTDYLNAALVYHDWVIAQPQLDLPESHPTTYTLEALPDVPNVENESINDLIRLYKTAITEIISSQSARLGAGFTPHDSERFVKIIEKMQKFMIDYVAVVTPLDLPESSPEEPLSGSGRTGV